MNTPRAAPSSAGQAASIPTDDTHHGARAPAPQANPAPFLKWAGSKRRLLSQLLPLLPPGQRLIEPFVGAGSVFMATDYPHYLLADTNAVLMTLYAELQANPHRAIAKAMALFVPDNCNQQAYLALRARFNDPATEQSERAALFVYLNKFAFNGLYRVNKRGAMNVSYAHHQTVPGFPEAAMTQFAHKLQRAELSCAGFEQTMAQAVPGDVVYCDPPYLPMNHGRPCFTAYGPQGFGVTEHQRLAGMARELAGTGIPVVISNHDSPTTRALYAGATLHTLQTHRSLAAKESARGNAVELVAVFTG